MILMQSMYINFSKKFKKQQNKADAKIKSALNKKIKLFLQDQFTPHLHNHALIGEFKGYRSINITGDFRALYSESVDKDGNQIIIFEMLGTHSQLYK